MLRLLVGSLIVIFVVPIGVNAATLYMSPQNLTLARSDSATVSIRLDVDADECINVVDAVVTFPETIVPVDVSRGRSILSLWVEEPVIDRDSNTITFAGGIPNGYCGRIVGDPRLTNNIVDIIVQSPSFVVGQSGDATTTAATLDFGPETRLLRNDNFGSEANATLLGTTVTLTRQAGQGDSDWLDIVAADETPPNDFSISLERTPNAFNNEFFITFNTTDKQSGIDHYEVIEEPIDDLPFFKWSREDAPWVEVRSPYVLKDQSLNSVVRVRAIDKAGNEFVSTLIPEESVRTMSDSTKVVMILILGAVVSLLLVMGLVAWFVTRRNRKGDEFEEDEQDEYESDDEEALEEVEDEGEDEVEEVEEELDEEDEEESVELGETSNDDDVPETKPKPSRRLK